MQTKQVPKYNLIVYEEMVFFELTNNLEFLLFTDAFELGRHIRKLLQPYVMYYSRHRLELRSSIHKDESKSLLQHRREAIITSDREFLAKLKVRLQLLGTCSNYVKSKSLLTANQNRQDLYERYKAWIESNQSTAFDQDVLNGMFELVRLEDS